MNKLLYGAAYYDEYMPYERLDWDMQMMRDAGIGVIRIAESTWATEEPQNGVFDFSHVERVLEAAKNAEISVIVGTPTYAIPPWLAAEHPDIIAMTERGKGKYGARQNMDITSPVYLFHAERVIRKLMECVQKYPNVIGFQLDNETKHYHTSGPNVQKRFVQYLKKRFGTVEELNDAFGFNYWSNRVDSWENIPDVTGTINFSFYSAFETFRRTLVDEFLLWQSAIVHEYTKEGQFITHNFDYDWRNFSFGVQPDVDHKSAAKAVTIAGCDIYHPSQDLLTGKEIAFGGDICRSLKQDNYYVIETQAQGHVNWTPFKGQLRLQAFSHFASGANAVMYWHWHSIHNSFETYWKGILSHDLQPNAAYKEVSIIGADINRLSPKLVNLQKKNDVAILISNESLTALGLFRLPDHKTSYNDIFRLFYDALYEMNVECDILFPEDMARFSDYKILIVPALYSAVDELLLALKEYTVQGGELLCTFKTGFSDENLKVRTDMQPGLLSNCFGVKYDAFTEPQNVSLIGDQFDLTAQERGVSVWMEHVTATTASVLSSYKHPFWNEFAAVTENEFGGGFATYVACLPGKAYVKELLLRIIRRSGCITVEHSISFPIIIKKGINHFGKKVIYYFNFSEKSVKQTYLHEDAVELLSETQVKHGDVIDFAPWGFTIYEEN